MSVTRLPFRLWAETPEHLRVPEARLREVLPPYNCSVNMTAWRRAWSEAVGPRGCPAAAQVFWTGWGRRYVPCRGEPRNGEPYCRAHMADSGLRPYKARSDADHVAVPTPADPSQSDPFGCWL